MKQYNHIVYLLLTLLFLPFLSFAQPVVQCALILQQFSISLQDKNRQHPDALDVFQLKKGDRVFVDASVFDSFSMIKKKIKEKVISMQVVQVKDSNIYLEHVIIGKVGILQGNLRGHVYRRADYFTRSAFKRGEWVQVDLEKGENALGQFERVIDAEYDEVKILYSNKAQPEFSRISKSHVHKLASRNKDVLEKAFHVFDSVGLPMQEGEKIRFREKNGSIKSGIILKKEKEKFKIKDEEGREVKMSSSLVFKASGFVPPFTPIFSVGWEGAFSNPPEGFTIEFLNGGAKFTSIEDFSKMTNQEKLGVLTRYTQILIPWTEVGIRAEQYGLDTMHSILCAGVGVCRHQVILLATLLVESGFLARVVYAYKDKSEQQGHAWIEVDMKDDNRITTFIVDPALNTIFPLRQVRRNSWYANPDRQTLLPEPFEAKK